MFHMKQQNRLLILFGCDLMLVHRGGGDLALELNFIISSLFSTFLSLQMQRSQGCGFSILLLHAKFTSLLEDL